jgi:hypothetical protein
MLFFDSPSHKLSLEEQRVRSYDAAGQVTHIAQITPLSKRLQQIDHYTPRGSVEGRPITAFSWVLTIGTEDSTPLILTRCPCRA